MLSLLSDPWPAGLFARPKHLAGRVLEDTGMQMQLTVVEENGLKVVEGLPDHPFLANVADTDRLVEACLSERVSAVLLYDDNLTPGFFDLSSRDAGAILQKLRQYRIRLAVVCAGRSRFSSRFGEMEAEERKGPHFAVFESRVDAREWLGR